MFRKAHLKSFRKVKTYDIEWYSGSELIDLTWHIGKDHTYLLTYGVPENFSWQTIMTQPITIDKKLYRGFHPRFVDAISINSPIGVYGSDGKSKTGTWYWTNGGWISFTPPSKNGKLLEKVKQLSVEQLLKIVVCPNYRNENERIYDTYCAFVYPTTIENAKMVDY